MLEVTKKLSKDERIAARTQRVGMKKHKDERLSVSSSPHPSAPSASSSSLSHEQIVASRDKLDARQRDITQEIGDIFQEREFSELQRRKAEETKYGARFERLERELADSRRISAEIEARWEAIAKKDIPQELYAEIAAQYKKASSLLASKDELIKFLQNELKTKDEDYVELLSQHQEDINQLLSKMKTFFHDFLKLSKDELTSIERVFLEERNNLLQSYKEEIDQLFNERRRMELTMMESKQLREKKYALELAEIRNRDAEDYNSLKIDLENSIQIFEQQLEEMRATYQLNSEKLEYNHSVLIERDLENKATVEHHRQRLRRLKENLSILIQKFHKQDNKFKQENAVLTEEYKRMTEQFKDLQKKYAHFVMIDTKKYQDVWEMNEQHVMALVHKVLHADQIIHNQILGLNWHPPLIDAHTATTPIDIDSITSVQIFQNSVDNQLSKTQIMQPTTPSVDKSIALASPTASKYTAEQIKAVMDLVTNEVSFLLDSRVQDIMNTLQEKGSANLLDLKNEQDMYRSDAILAAVGVEDREDLDELIACFYEEQPGHAHSANDRPTVHPNDVAKVIKDFVVKRQQVKTKAGAMGVAVKQPLDSVNIEKKARKKEKERLFWQRLGGVISNKTKSVWTALEQWQHKYNTLLEERCALIDDTSELAKQNEELKILLQEYLGSKVNQELHIPPTKLIRTNQT